MEDHAIKNEIQVADNAINRKDFDAVADCYTEDAVLIVAPGLEARGKGEIRQAHQNISDYFNDSLEVSQGNMVIIEAGDTALVLSKTFVDSPGKLDSEFSTERNATYVYVKDESGKWRCAIDNSYGPELLNEPS
jgi:uncharacterized protein (TIGR02246 family)